MLMPKEVFLHAMNNPYQMQSWVLSTQEIDEK